MDTNQLVEQLLRGSAPPEVLSELPDAMAAAVIERFQQEAERYWTIDPHRSLEFADRIVAIGQARADPLRSALGMMARGDALKFLGHMQEAWNALEQAGNMFQAMGDEVGWARTRISLLFLSTRLNRVSDALEEAEHAREIFTRHAMPERLLRLDWQKGNVYNELGDQERALHHLHAALVTAEALGETGKQYLPHLYMNLGLTYIALGDAPQALASLEHARRFVSIFGMENVDCYEARKSLKDLLLGRSLESDELQRVEAHVATCPYCQMRLQLLAMEIVMKPEGTCSIWRDQLHAYVEAQLAGHGEDAEFVDLRRHLDACVDCSEAYALLYETMWAEQQGMIPEPPTMPRLDTSFLASPPAPSPSQHELMMSRNSEEFWDLIRARLSDEKERLVIYDSLILDLKPKEIYAQNRGLFRDIKEVYACKAKAVARLGRDPKFREFLEKTSARSLRRNR